MLYCAASCFWPAHLTALQQVPHSVHGHAFANLQRPTQQLGVCTADSSRKRGRREVADVHVDPPPCFSYCCCQPLSAPAVIEPSLLAGSCCCSQHEPSPPCGFHKHSHPCSPKVLIHPWCPHLLRARGVVVAACQLRDALQRSLAAPRDAQQPLHVIAAAAHQARLARVVRLHMDAAAACLVVRG